MPRGADITRKSQIFDARRRDPKHSLLDRAVQKTALEQIR